MRAILYYPTIQIPNGDWLRKTLLYWDAVCSIVPYAVNETLHEAEDIRLLIEHEVYYPLFPARFYEEAPRDLLEEFRKDLREIRVEQSMTWSVAGRKSVKIHEEKANTFKVPAVPMHIEKLMYGVIPPQYIVEWEEDRYGEWLRLEDRYAFAYMSLLAKYMAKYYNWRGELSADKPCSMSVGTDSMRFNRYIINPRNRRDSFTLGYSLVNALPVPRKDVPLGEILRFKQKRRDNLLHFREELDNFRQRMAASESAEELAVIGQEFSERIERGVLDLEAVLKDARINFAKHSYDALLPSDGRFSAWLRRGLTAWTSFQFPWAAGILAGLTIGRKYVDYSQERDAALRNSPFAYIYQGQKCGILNPFYLRK